MPSLPARTPRKLFAIRERPRVERSRGSSPAAGGSGSIGWQDERTSEAWLLKALCEGRASVQLRPQLRNERASCEAASPGRFTSPGRPFHGVSWPCYVPWVAGGAPGNDDYGLALIALEEVAGPAIVLDSELRIVAHTLEARELVGSELPEGVKAPKVLCGESEERPVAEALAAGRAVSAQVSRPGPDGPHRVIDVRATPLFQGNDRVGWLLLLEENAQSLGGPDAAVEFHGIWTRDATMKRLLRNIGKVARSDVNVLVRGETGSGKELVARAIHAESKRHAGPFRAINCAALPAQLLESELFGHVRGAFTGAVRDAEGHLRLAHEGTLFLDEVAELPLELQAKLLRVLEDRTVLPVGGREPIPVDVRFVAATHRSLRREVEAGRFRADLMYRLRVVPLFLPPLRDRKGDVALLARRFVEARSRSADREVQHLTPGAIARLEEYDFPGNVRELQNAIEYAFVIGEGPVLTEADLPPEVLGDEAQGSRINEPPALEEAGDLPPEARRILRALERASGNKERAAASLGMSRVTLWRKLKAFGLDV